MCRTAIRIRIPPRLLPRRQRRQRLIGPTPADRGCAVLIHAQGLGDEAMITAFTRGGAASIQGCRGRRSASGTVTMRERTRARARVPLVRRRGRRRGGVVRRVCVHRVADGGVHGGVRRVDAGAVRGDGALVVVVA